MSIGGLMIRMRPGRFFGRGFVALSIILVAGCESYDRKAELTRADYEELMARRAQDRLVPDEEPAIPELQPILAAPVPPLMADTRRISLSVTEDTPLRDLLIELARKAEVDLEMDPRISGGIIFSARDRPLQEVVERIAAVAGLRYRFRDNVLRMEIDEPYIESYRLDVLNLTRSAESEIGTNTDVFASIEGGAQLSGNASSSAIRTQSNSDFWEELSTNITRILETTRTQRSLVGRAALPLQPLPIAAPTPPPPTEEDPENGADLVQQAEQLVEQPDPVAVDDTANGEIVAEATPASSLFSINRQSGIITVFANERQQRLIRDYLDKLKSYNSAQVLIEAKIVEVTLSDRFRSGINWSRIIEGSSFQFATNLARNVVDPPLTDVEPTFAISHRINNIDAAVEMINTFGTVRTLSSPRLTVMNNQTAILKVAENEVYFTVDVSTTVSDGTPITTFSSTLQTVPIGLVMTVQPSINREQEQVSLGLRPTVSRISRRVQDPAVTLQDANVQSLVPVVEVREIDSLVTIGSGQVLVMGGLMQERADREEEAVPLLGRIPVVGHAFKSQFRDTEVVELVIFLRAVIVRDADSVAPADIDLYNRFAPDPRPIAF